MLYARVINTTTPSSCESSANEAAESGKFFQRTNENEVGKQLEHVVTLVVGVKIEMREK